MNGLLGVAMAPRTRRVVQALLYELVAISLVTPAIAIFLTKAKALRWAFRF